MKVTIEKVRLQFSFWGAPTHADIIEFSNSLLQLKNQRSRRKTVWLFYYFYFEKNYDVLKSKSPCFLLNKNINFKKTKLNWKWKIPHTVLERWTMSISSYKDWELKVKLWCVGARERKKGAFFITYVLFCRKGIFLAFVFYLNV